MADHTGDIRMTGFNETLDQYYERLTVGQCYVVTGGIIKQAYCAPAAYRTACCLLPAACCLPPPASRLLPPASCLPPPASRYRCFSELSRALVLAVTCHLQQKTGAGMSSATCCYWDSENDGADPRTAPFERLSALT